MQGPLPNHVYNYMPQGTALAIINKIPVDFDNDNPASSVSINALISTFDFPGLNIDLKKEYHFTTATRIPMQVENEFNNQISLSMILDDRMDNYWTLYRYGRTMLRPQDGYPERDRKLSPYNRQEIYAQRRMTVPFIDIRISDGSLELWNVIRLKKCYLEKLGSLSFSFGSEGEMTFNTTWSYDNLEWIRVEQHETLPQPVAD